MNVRYSSERDGAPLTDKLLANIAKHLNQDHLDDLLACAQAADLNWVEQARVVKLDAAGIDLEISGGGKAQPLRLDFPMPAKGVLSLRRSLGAMITESRVQLGWAAAVEND